MLSSDYTQGTCNYLIVTQYRTTRKPIMKYQKNVSLALISGALIFTLCAIGSSAKNLVTDTKVWLGEKVMFLPQPEKSQKYGYQQWGYTKKIGAAPKSLGIKHDELAGKTGEIVDVRKDERLPYIYTTVKLEDSEKLVVNQSLSGYRESTDKRSQIHAVGFIKEFRLAQGAIGMEIWNNRLTHISTTTIEPEDGTYFGKLPLSNLEHCKVIGVEWGFTNLAPIRFNLTCDGNKSGFWDGSMHADNVIGVFRPFPIAWHTKDPKAMYPKWSAEIWKTIEATKIKIGMTPEMAEMSWGKPQKINQDSGSWGIHEQWIYDDQYLYFENGKLTSFQSPK